MRQIRLPLLYLLVVLSSYALLVKSACIQDKQNNSKNSKIINKDLEPIDSAGKVHLGYEVNLETNIISFNVVVQTRGFVGFGLSPGGGMTGADIVIGGVYDDGRSYFSDRHGVGNSEPVLDRSQDWELNAIFENATHTTLRFSRLLNTCDNQDVAITSDTMRLIWSFGETDVIQYHGATNRGTYSVNLLDPVMPPFDESSYDKWTVMANLTTMPARDTSYWCTMHKSPASYNNKRHVVGLKTVLDSVDSLKHTHHLTVFRCTAPEGEDPDQVFGQFVGKEGHECYVPPEEQVIPTDLCRAIVYVWAVGGKMMTFPENVGLPIIESGQPEYWMLEIHYNNPESLPGVKFNTAIEVFNTPQLREQEAAVLIVAHGVTFSHVIPARVNPYVTIGHCSSQCTQNSINPEGVNLFNVMLHSHKTGRKIKLRQFRDRTELPWITNDDNYDFDFQQNRPLREHVKLMPGDHLTVECTQSTLDRSNVTIAGFSTEDEMCQAIMFYYPADELRFCESAFNEAKIMERFGIEELEWINLLNPPIVLKPETMANKSFTEVLDTMVEWNPEVIEELQQQTRFTNHYQVNCGFIPFTQKEKLNQWKKAKEIMKNEDGIIGYPELDEVYEPENPCVKN